LKKRDNIIREIISLYKIKTAYKKRKYLIETHLEESKKISNFNLPPLFDRKDIILENYLISDILYCYFCMEFSISENKQAFYANTLVRLLGSFLDLYAQVLNNFYDLELNPLRKDIAPNIFSEGVVTQAINGVKDSDKKYKSVSLNTVIKKIKSKYQTNEYFDAIEKILGEDEIQSMSILRNYETHYQSIFSKYNQSYRFDSDGSYNKIFSTNGSIYDKGEFDKFMELSQKVINLYLSLVYYFNKMLFDRKLIEHGKKTEEVYILQCPECSEKFFFTELQRLNYDYGLSTSIEHKKCSSKNCLTWTNKKMDVHPDKYTQMMLQEVEAMKNGELKIYDDKGEEIRLYTID
jgi:hypothetical protein